MSNFNMLNHRLALKSTLVPKLVSNFWRVGLVFVSIISFSFLLGHNPAMAHHPFGGNTPTNFWQGFLSGLGHPIIGVDHFAFVVAVGLLAALKSQGGMAIPIAFIGATLAGTGIHLLEIDLPAVETSIAFSVLIFGIMLAMRRTPNSRWIVGLGLVAGIFHGYAYGEAIIGAQMTPLVAYLSGFAAIQLGVAMLAFWLGKLMLNRVVEQTSLPLRFAGFTLCGAGVAFLSSTLLG